LGLWLPCPFACENLAPYHYAGSDRKMPQCMESRKNWLLGPTFRYCEFVIAVAVNEIPKFVQTARSEDAWNW